MDIKKARMEISQASTSAKASALEKQTFGAQIVSKTLDTMNSGSMGSDSSQNGMSQTYDSTKSVLGPHAGRAYPQTPVLKMGNRITVSRDAPSRLLQ